MNIPDEVREKHYKICENCKERKFYASQLDIHFDWIDCIYDCENDIEHFESEGKDGRS